jgi:hypothetical protein
MPDCGPARCEMPAYYETRAQCARKTSSQLFLFYVVKRFELNGRANGERQPAIIRINGCVEPRLFNPGPTATPKGVRPAGRLKGSSSQTKRQVITEPRTHFDAHAISSFSPGMQAAFITCVSPRLRLCRRLGGEEFGLRISTPAIASRSAAAVNSRNTSATPAPIKGNAALGMKSAALLIEDLLRCNGKPRATQSFIPPSTGTAFTQPADRRIPVARLARA